MREMARVLEQRPGCSLLLVEPEEGEAVAALGCSEMVLGEVYPAEERKVSVAIVFGLVLAILLGTGLLRMLEKTL